MELILGESVVTDIAEHPVTILYISVSQIAHFHNWKKIKMSKASDILLLRDDNNQSISFVSVLLQ